MTNMKTADSRDIEARSARLVSARQTATPLADFPGALPVNSAEAYAVQSCSISNWPERIAGWKVGGIAPAFRDAFGASWLVGPFFGPSIKTVADGGHVDMPVFKGGFAAMEAEYVFELGDVNGLKTPPKNWEDSAQYITAIYTGAEIASSPLGPINNLGPGAIISDFGNNGGVIKSESVALDRLLSLHEIEVTVEINGKVIGKSPAKPGGTGGPLDAFHYFLTHHLSRGYTPPEGTLVSSGAITGVHDSPSGNKHRVIFDGVTDFTCDFVERPAMNV